MSRSLFEATLEENGIEYDEKAVPFALELMAKFHLSEDELVNEYQSLTTCENIIGILNKSKLLRLQKQRLSKKPKSSDSTINETPKKRKRRISVNMQSQFRDMRMSPSMSNMNTNQRSVHSTPYSKRCSLASVMESPVGSTYQQRKNRGECIVSFNNHLPLAIPSNDKSNVIHTNDIIFEELHLSNPMLEDIEYDDLSADHNLRTFMCEDIHSKQQLLKKWIANIGKYIMDDIKKDVISDDSKENEIEYASVMELSQTKQYFLGRIMNDGESNDRLSVNSLVLEGDWDCSYGQRIKLDISQLSHYSLFPGQIVCIEGTHTSNHEILVSRIYCNASLPKHLNMNIGEIEEPLTIVCAVGPFTLQNNLQFKNSPFEDLADMICHRTCPQIIILVGPFTDMNNDYIAKCLIDISFQELFQQLLHQFIEYLRIRNYHARILIVPALTDIHHITCFPQPRYSFDDGNHMSDYFYNQTNFLSNPSQFRITFGNNKRTCVSMAVSNVDFMFHCMRQSIFKSAENKNQLQAMMEHCIEQQCFYPMFPANRCVRMDFTHFHRMCMSETPDIFIMPSKLNRFVFRSEMSNVLCVNPSFLSKVNSGGTYAVITVHGRGGKENGDSTQNIRVDLLRI